MKRMHDQQKFASLFEEYTHNLPVIFSSLEGQYDGELWVDNEIHPNFAVLFTPFAFHFVAGNPNHDFASDWLDEAIFRQYLAQTGQNEAIVFGPNAQWDRVLDQVFIQHGGVKDVRKNYQLDRACFDALSSQSKALPGLTKVLRYEQEQEAKRAYPICRIMDAQTCVSYCSGFMLGHGHAEIDVWTEESHRRKGLARQAAISLIGELQNNGIEPDWCLFPYRKESEELALSLGFTLKSIVPVHIWQGQL